VPTKRLVGIWKDTCDTAAAAATTTAATSDKGGLGVSCSRVEPFAAAFSFGTIAMAALGIKHSQSPKHVCALTETSTLVSREIWFRNPYIVLGIYHVYTWYILQRIYHVYAMYILDGYTMYIHGIYLAYPGAWREVGYTRYIHVLYYTTYISTIRNSSTYTWNIRGIFQVYTIYQGFRIQMSES
jgi:hypothetical protein